MNHHFANWGDKIGVIGLVVVGMIAAEPVSARADTIFESFENGFDAWRANADMQREWSVSRSTDFVEDGSWALNITGDGLNDDGTIWVRRQLLLPAGSYTVGLEFAIWKAGEGIVGVVPAIGFIGLRDPAIEDDFTLSPEGEEFFPAFPAGYTFHQMSRPITVSESTVAYVAFGYNIVFENIITRYFDSVTLTGIPTQCGDGTCLWGEDRCNCPVDCGGGTSAEVCDDGDDNDCDGFPDCHDTECVAHANCFDVCVQNFFCDEWETHESCPSDCAGGVVGFCDMDGTCDFGENQCNCPEDCGAAPGTESICDDSIDNDCDGSVDCADSDCANDPACPPGGCNNNGTCEFGEDCNSCPNDCISLSGATCGNGVCEAGDGEDCVSCSADCNGKQGGKPSSRFCCGDGDGQNPLSCSDAVCGGPAACTDTPAPTTCCGDDTCEGTEDVANCAIDCACASAAECDDEVACTDDDCVSGVCQNTPNHANCSDDGVFCNGSESCDAVGGCVSSGDPCASNENCDEGTQSCIPCTPKNGTCTSDAECCSGDCKANGRCR